PASTAARWPCWTPTRAPRPACRYADLPRRPATGGAPAAPARGRLPQGMRQGSRSLGKKSLRVFRHPQRTPMELALVDFDHTVTTCGAYARSLRRVATPEQITGSRWSIGPWVAGYRLGVVSATALRVRATRLVFAGREASEIKAAGADYAGRELPGLVRPEMME